jgi:hypothetical protein
MPDDLLARMKLANGADDCTCNVAEHSREAMDHDPYCAFPLLQQAAAKIESDARTIAALRSAFLGKIMSENDCYCFQRGVPCDPAKCGCILEMEAAINDALKESNEQFAGESENSPRRRAAKALYDETMKDG